MRFGEIEGDRIDIRPEIQGGRTGHKTKVSHSLTTVQSLLFL